MLPAFVKTVMASYIKDVDTRSPDEKRGRPKAASHDTIIDMVFFVLRTGCQWRLLPTLGQVSWQTVYRHFRLWSRKGVFEKTYKHLRDFYLRRYAHHRRFLITDTSFVKNIGGTNCTGPSSVDRGRKANKISVVVDETGIPWGITFHKGNKADCKAFVHTVHSEINRLQGKYRQNKTFLGDKAYDSNRCNSVVRSLGWRNEVARRKPPHPYKFSSIRIRVEHTFAWLDQYRRIILRYERTITQYKSFTYMALCHLISRRL